VKKPPQADTRRPLNRTCNICGGKASSPEKSGGRWYFRSAQKCTIALCDRIITLMKYQREKEYCQNQSNA
jgi:hypothetical protein